MRRKFHFEHRVELGERPDQMGDNHECCHVVGRVHLLEVAEEVDEGQSLPFG